MGAAARSSPAVLEKPKWNPSAVGRRKGRREHPPVTWANASTAPPVRPGPDVAVAVDRNGDAAVSKEGRNIYCTGVPEAERRDAKVSRRSWSLTDRSRAFRPIGG